MTRYRAQPKTHRHVERGDDFYATPPAAVQALLSVYQPSHRIWEPACGDGAIVKVLRAAGHDVIATDLNDWGCPQSSARVDFLMERAAPPQCRCIITNPPYRLAEQFIAHALRLVPEVAMLCRLAFLESARRTQLLERSGLHRVIVFRDRLPMMHRHGWTGPKNSSSTAFAWFCWSRGYTGLPTLERISAADFRASLPAAGQEAAE
jgi:hypothetical protein